MKCGAVWCSAVQCGAVWCRVVQCIKERVVENVGRGILSMEKGEISTG